MKIHKKEKRAMNIYDLFWVLVFMCAFAVLLCIMDVGGNIIWNIFSKDDDEEEEVEQNV